MRDWAKVAIGTVAEIFDGPHATPKTVDFGPIFLGIGALKDGRINLGETRHVTPEDFRTWTRRVKPRSGDVVFSYETRLGEAAMIPDGFECCLGRRMGLVRADRSRLDPRFFLYTYLSPNFQDFIRSRTIRGATVDRIALKEFPSFPVPLPSMNEQLAISSILGALDDKIDLNHRMNKTLEAMARTIFKDWFVDFGPTRAKMEGRAPYLAPDTWKLFPARLDDADRPVGWEEVKLGDLCARVAMGPFGSDITTDNFVDRGVPIIRGGNLRCGFIDHGFVYVTEAKADSLKNANAFPEDIVITHRGTLGQVGIIPKSPNYPRYVVSQSQMLLSADPVRSSPRFIFEFLRSERGMQQLLAFTSQVGVPAISRPTTSLKVLKIVAPPSEILVHFDSLLAPLVEREIANTLETRRLTHMRDLLLPRLMSGEILLRDAEKIAEVAT